MLHSSIDMLKTWTCIRRNLICDVEQRRTNCVVRSTCLQEILIQVSDACTVHERLSSTGQMGAESTHPLQPEDQAAASAAEVADDMRLPVETGDAAKDNQRRTARLLHLLRSNNLEQVKEATVDTADHALIASALEAPQSIHSHTEAHHVHRPWEPSHKKRLAVVIPDILTDAECQRIIRTCERVGFEEALLNVGAGKQISAPSVRKSGRCIVDDLRAAELLYDRVRPFVPAEFSVIHGGATWRCVGLNERFRVLKYEPGDYFAPHKDGHFVRMQGVTPLVVGEPRDTSFLTLMFYLNTPVRGGNTNFLNARNETEIASVAPREGVALCFEHDLLHEGALLEAGVKYCIRTDVMYRRETLSSTPSH